MTAFVTIKRTSGQGIAIFFFKYATCFLEDPLHMFDAAPEELLKWRARSGVTELIGGTSSQIQLGTAGTGASPKS